MRGEGTCPRPPSWQVTRSPETQALVPNGPTLCHSGKSTSIKTQGDRGTGSEARGATLDTQGMGTPGSIEGESHRTEDQPGHRNADLTVEDNPRTEG